MTEDEIEYNEFGFPKYMGMKELLEKLKFRKQKGGGHGTRKATPRVQSLFDEMVSKGYSRKYLTRRFSKIRDSDLEQYHGNEEYFIKDAAMYFLEQHSNTKPSVDQFIQAGFSEEAAEIVYDSIELLIDDSSYTYQQLYEIGVDFLVKKEYKELLPQNATFFHRPDILEKGIKYKNTKIYNIPYKCENNAEMRNYLFQYLNKTNNNVKYYYHTTNWRSCQNIFNGVDHTKGRDCLDFGTRESFYLSPNLNLALRWGFNKEKIYKHEIGIVIFAVPQFPSRLKVKDFKTPTKEWENGVYLSRLCHFDETVMDSWNDLDDYDFVQGPLVANPENVKNKIERPIAIPKSIQLASKTDESDQFLDKCLVGAFIFVKNKNGL